MFCGIDFGTSNSTVALAGPDGPARLIALEGDQVTLPSAVFWPSDGEAPSFGRAAVQDYIRGEDGRLMRALKSTLGSALIDERTSLGARSVSLRAVLARFFRHLRERLDAEAPGLTRVVLGRPVHFVDDDPAADDRAQGVLEEIARAQGFTEIAFQFEPIAAALEYETTLTSEALVLIVDIGGGTSDFSVLRLSPARAAAPDRAGDILSSHGIRLGGTDFDRILSIAEAMPHLGWLGTTRSGTGVHPRRMFLDLATWHRINTLYTQRTLTDLKAMREAADRPDLIDRLERVIRGHHGHQLLMAVEAAKIGLSAEEVARIQMSAFTGGPNPLAHRSRFQEASAEALSRMGAAITETLGRAGVTLVDRIFLTGGSAGLPMLRGLLDGLLPDVPVATGDMLGSVGVGLALEARRRFG